MIMVDKHNPGEKPPKSIEFLGVFAAILLGTFLRLSPIIQLDFPLNDGGAFLAITQDIVANNFAFPKFATYNLSNIPFAYPPLVFYTTAFITKIFQWSLPNIIRMLPAVVSILTIPAFYGLARRILKNPLQILVATFGFTLMPTAFDWLVVGGGLTRSFGYLFAILCLQQIYELYTTRYNKPIFLGSLFAGLTILSHPGTAWFLFYSSLTIFLFHFKNRPHALRKSIIIGVGSLVLISPWLIRLHKTHGIAVLAYPFQTEGFSLASIITPFTFLFTNEPLLDIFAFGGLLGVIACLFLGKYFLPVWLLSVFVFETRLGPTYSVVPMTLLVGVGFDSAILPLLKKPNSNTLSKIQKMLPKILVGYLLLYSTIAAFMAINYESVSSPQRQIMAWIQANTPELSRFIVLTGQPEYGIDHVSEWFPTLTHRHSLTTPQFHEWLPDQAFNQRIELHRSVQICNEKGLGCLSEWVQTNNIKFTHIYIANHNPENQTLAYQMMTKALVDSPEYNLIHSGAGGMVFINSAETP